MLLVWFQNHPKRGICVRNKGSGVVHNGEGVISHHNAGEHHVVNEKNNTNGWMDKPNLQPPKLEIGSQADNLQHSMQSPGAPC